MLHALLDRRVGVVINPLDQPVHLTKIPALGGTLRFGDKRTGFVQMLLDIGLDGW